MRILRHYDNNITRIRQCAVSLGYGEPQILELVIFAIMDLRQAIDAIKKVMTKERLDRQMTGHASTPPVMTVKDIVMQGSGLYILAL